MLTVPLPSVQLVSGTVPTTGQQGPAFYRLSSTVKMLIRRKAILQFPSATPIECCDMTFTFTFTLCYEDDYFKTDIRGEKCSMNEKSMLKMRIVVWSKILKVRTHLENVVVDSKVILKWNLTFRNLASHI